MKEFFGNPYAGELKPEGRFVAFAIGQESDYDQLRVGNQLVSAGRVTLASGVVENPLVKYERGPKGYTTGSQIVVKPLAHLLCFECMAEAKAYSRPNRRYTVQMVDQCPQNSGNMRNAAFAVIPFAGRRHGMVRVMTYSTACQLAVYGRQWYGYDGVVFRAAGTSGGGGAPAFAVGTNAGFIVPLVGTLSAPKVIAASPNPAAALNGPLTGEYIGDGWHFGGTNDAEYYDDVIVFVSSSDASSPTVILDIEIAGESGRG